MVVAGEVLVQTLNVRCRIRQPHPARYTSVLAQARGRGFQIPFLRKKPRIADTKAREARTVFHQVGLPQVTPGLILVVAENGAVDITSPPVFPLIVGIR